VFVGVAILEREQKSFVFCKFLNKTKTNERKQKNIFIFNNKTKDDFIELFKYYFF